MGHQHLGTLPASRKWQQVIQLISSGAEVKDVAAATSAAAERQMQDASNDPAVKHAFWLLTQIPTAARKQDFPTELKKLGLEVGNEPTLLEIVMAMSAAVDRYVERTGGRSDLGEMAQLSASESLSAVAGRELAELFETPPEQTQATLASLGTVKQFAVLARDFFSRLARRQLTYFLSRELPQHVGVNERFQTIRQHRDFDEAFDLHCREGSRILKEFSGQWFSKHNFLGGIDQRKAGRFVHAALDKFRKELRRRRDAHV